MLKSDRSLGAVVKGLALGGLALAAMIAGPAVAADMPVKAPPPARAFSWTGCYVGVNGGWAGERDEYRLQPASNYLNAPGGAPPPNTAGTGDFAVSIAALTTNYTATSWNGGTVGGTFGCQTQTGWLVGGFEGDFNWSGSRTTVDAFYPAFPNPGNPVFTNQPRTEHVTNRLESFATARVRVGAAWDRALLYATGGFAWGFAKSDTAVLFGQGAAVTSVYNGAQHIGSDRFNLFGLAAGAGFEYAFINNWSFKLEYMALLFGSRTYSSPLVAAVPAFAPGYAWQTQVRTTEQVVRAGLNYRFQWW